MVLAPVPGPPRGSSLAGSQAALAQQLDRTRVAGPSHSVQSPPDLMTPTPGDTILSASLLPPLPKTGQILQSCSRSMPHPVLPSSEITWPRTGLCELGISASRAKAGRDTGRESGKEP